MKRRHFLGAVGGLAAASACGPRSAPPTAAPLARGPRTPIRGICFDLFTLFDPRSVVAVAEGVVPGRGAALCESWRARQFEYAWLRAAGDRYADFEVVTAQALTWAARTQQLDLSDAQRRQLVSAYSELTPWPDTRGQLTAWREAGLKLAPLANYAPAMIERLLAQAELTSLFDALISTDRARCYKPQPAAYALGPEVLGLPREALAFSAFGGWDAAGARWFGFPTFWVNRLGAVEEVLDAPPDGTGPTLRELAAFVEGWA